MYNLKHTLCIEKVTPSVRMGRKAAGLYKPYRFMRQPDCQKGKRQYRLIFFGHYINCNYHHKQQGVEV